MGEILLLRAGGGGSVISRNLRTEKPFRPSLAPQPCRAIDQESIKSFIQSWHLAAEDPTLRGIGVLCGQDHQTPWLPVLSRRQQAPGHLCSVPGILSHHSRGRCRHSSQLKRWASLVQPCLILEPGFGLGLKFTQGKACGQQSREMPRLSAAWFHIVTGEESSPLRADTLAPAIRVAAGDADDSALREGEFIVLLARVWVQCHHCKAEGEGVL